MPTRCRWAAFVNGSSVRPNHEASGESGATAGRVNAEATARPVRARLRMRRSGVVERGRWRARAPPTSDSKSLHLGRLSIPLAGNGRAERSGRLVIDLSPLESAREVDVDR